MNALSAFRIPYDTSDSHLYLTMASDTVPMETRLTIARQLLKNHDPILRSKAHWFLVKQNQFNRVYFK